MPKFILLFSGAPRRAGEQQNTDVTWDKWIERLRQRNIYQAGSALPMQGKTIAATGEVNDFRPTPTSIGGYAVITATSLNDAVEIARTAPHSQSGGVTEVRPCRDAG